MALYRTISDRGLWKKNQRNQDPQPQHFHKPQYIDHQAPQVTYSRLSLGEGYRHNSRQSIPDINKDIDAANKRFDQVYSSQSGRNFKSCPTTPRATTPTRYLSRSRATLGGQETDIDHGEHGDYLSSSAVITRSTFSRGSYAPSPYNTGSIYGQTFAEDDRYSFESRSLTAYSNYSERDSVIDSNYRYPYAREPAYNYQYQPDPRITAEARDNTVLQQVNNNSTYDANNVVNLFLQKSFFPNVTNNNDFPGDAPVVNGVKPSYNSNSTVSPVSDSQTEPSSATPVSSPGYSTRAAIAQLKKEFLSREPEKPALRRPKANKYLQNRRSSGAGQSVTPSGDSEDTSLQPVTVPALARSPSPPPIVALDREPGSRAPSAAPVAPVPVPCAAIESNLVTAAPAQVASVTCEPPSSPARVPTPPVSLETTGPPQPGPGHNNRAVETGCPMEQAFTLSDTVQSQDIPKLHHAELCSLPRDTTQSSSSFTSSEEDAVDSARSLMVSINPVSQVRSEVESVQVQRIEAPPQRQNIWGPSPRHSVQHDQVQINSDQVSSVTSMGDQIFTHSASLFHPKAPLDHSEELQTEQVDTCARGNQFKASRSVSFENALDTETEAEEAEAPQLIERESEDDPILLERSFQDPAFANFVDSQKEKSPEKPKKKGFLSSLFKKSNKRQQPYGDDYIHIERKLDIWENSESEADSKIHDMMDQSPRFHFLRGDASPRPPVDINHHVPVVPMPGSPAARRLFPDSHDHQVEDQLHRVEDHGAWQEIPKTPQNNFGQEQDEIIQSMKVSPAPSPIKPNICEISKLHEEAHSSMDNSLPQQKPTSLDDLIDDFNKKQSVEISPPVSSHQPRFIPEHERTQEIDIDALLNLSDTPEETEEELLEEEQGQFSFTSSTQQTIYQREFSLDQNTLASMPEPVDHDTVLEQNQSVNDCYQDEEKRLEMEQTNLLKHNMALEQELRDRENERMNIAKDFGEVSTEATVHLEERPKSVSTSFGERKKPKSMFNFSSFRKPKNKEIAIHKPNVNTHSPNQSPNESFQKQEKPEIVQQSPTEDDLATKIVREIQKSTTELNLNQSTNQKPSFFNSNNLRKSVRGSNKKRIPKENNVEEEKIAMEKDEPELIAVNVTTKDESQDLSLEFRKEKKPGFFSLRSSSKDRKKQRRPVFEVETPSVAESQTITKSKSETNGFGSLFGAKRSRSQERQKGISSSPNPEQINGDSPQIHETDVQNDKVNEYDEISAEVINDVEKNEKKEKTKGFAFFGSNRSKPQTKNSSSESKTTQNKRVPKTISSRPTSKPPLPPSKPVSGLTDFFASQPDQHESPPLPQENSVQINQYPAPPLNQTLNGSTDLTATPVSSNSFSRNRHQETIDTSDIGRVSETLNDRKSSFLQSTLQTPPAPEVLQQMPDPRLSQAPPPETQRPPSQAQVPSLNSSFSEDTVKLRQTGRQSGRFRKSSSGLSEPQRVSVQRPKSTLSPSPSGTGAMLNSMIVDHMTRPTTPHHPSQTGSRPDSQPSDQRKKSSTISRTESYRRARGTEDDRPKDVKRNDTYNSLPHQQGTILKRGNSEDSLRNALDREQQSGHMPRSKSRQEKKGECSVM